MSNQNKLRSTHPRYGWLLLCSIRSGRKPQTPQASFTYRTRPFLRCRFGSLLLTLLHTPEAPSQPKTSPQYPETAVPKYAAIVNHSGKAVKVFSEKYLCAA
jgi:hypothetical protein